MRSLLVHACLLSCLLLPWARAGDACLRYAPVHVTVSGRLERLTFPGRPNYASVAEGDEPETGFYLALPQAICTDGDEASADAYPQKEVRLVQLVLDRRGYSALASSVGKYVTLGGVLVARHTGHHHAPLLLQGVTR